MSSLNPLLPYLQVWTRLSDRAVQRWEKALNEIEAREYTYDKLLSDSLGTWSDVTTEWCDVVGAAGRRPELVLYDITPTTQAGGTKKNRVRVRDLPIGVDPKILWRGRISGTPNNKLKQLKANNLDAAREKDTNVVIISLKDLYDANSPKELDKGDYHALVHVGDAVVAEVYIRVK